MRRASDFDPALAFGWTTAVVLPAPIGRYVFAAPKATHATTRRRPSAEFDFLWRHVARIHAVFFIHYFSLLSQLPILYNIRYLEDFMSVFIKRLILTQP